MKLDEKIHWVVSKMKTPKLRPVDRRPTKTKTYSLSRNKRNLSIAQSLACTSLFFTTHNSHACSSSHTAANVMIPLCDEFGLKKREQEQTTAI